MLALLSGPNCANIIHNLFVILFLISSALLTSSSKFSISIFIFRPGPFWVEINRKKNKQKKLRELSSNYCVWNERNRFALKRRKKKSVSQKCACCVSECRQQPKQKWNNIPKRKSIFFQRIFDFFFFCWWFSFDFWSSHLCRDTGSINLSFDHTVFSPVFGSQRLTVSMQNANFHIFLLSRSWCCLGCVLPVFVLFFLLNVNGSDGIAS